ncbi:hypothetical protein MIND_01234300 [Mycena indigotica]|uniref:Uncharacterized protein n=1 Tax=Mycena indigotica TaxID=2126181 RepID=A0A8H6VSD5_9AGAR|nr:uncharacterized protein MIND_01234300 [Mycena indigotica]KAF7292079.1 hypothetical protein MIND_01234300 [Mycena indigotica]
MPQTSSPRQPHFSLSSRHIFMQQLLWSMDSLSWALSLWSGSSRNLSMSSTTLFWSWNNAQRSGVPSHRARIPVFDENDKLVAYVRSKSQIQDHAAATRTSPTQHAPSRTGTTPTLHPTAGTAPRQPSYITLEAALWDGWPDGHVAYNIPASQMYEVGVFWSLEAIKGPRGGSLDAETVDKGRIFRGKCYGAITCSAPDCRYAVLIAPEQTLKAIAVQLLQFCRCGQSLERLRCGIECTRTAFRSGSLITHHGKHLHGRYTHRLPATTASTNARGTMHLVELGPGDTFPLIPKPRARSQAQQRPSKLFLADTPDRDDESEVEDMDIGMEKRGMGEQGVNTEDDMSEAERQEMLADPTADED